MLGPGLGRRANSEDAAFHGQAPWPHVDWNVRRTGSGDGLCARSVTGISADLPGSSGKVTAAGPVSVHRTSQSGWGRVEPVAAPGDPPPCGSNAFEPRALTLAGSLASAPATLRTWHAPTVSP